MLISKMKKGLVALLCAVACLSFAQGHADQYSAPCPPACPAPCNPCDNPCYSWFSPCDFDVGLGIFADTKSSIIGMQMIPYLTVIYKWFTVGFGVSAEKFNGDFGNHDGNNSSNRSNNSTSVVYYSMHAGLRYCLCPCFYLTGGASGMTTTVSSSDNTAKPFVIGPYLGFDYHLSPCVLLTAQILPYARTRSIVGGGDNNNSSGAFFDQYFQQGMIGISYLF